MAASDFKYPADKVMAFWAAVYRSDVDAMRRFTAEDAALLQKVREKGYAIVCEAAKESRPEVIRALVALGKDINEQDRNGNTGLSWAVSKERHEIAKALLDCGADPNLGCPIFGVACDELQDPIGMAKLLLDHGADINRLFLVEGLPPRTVLSEAVARGRTELVEFLKSRGAKPPGPTAASEPAEDLTSAAEVGDYSAEIVAHFRKHYGKPDKKVIREVVPTSDYPVVIHYISPSEKHEESAVLFTTGLSRFEMPAPKGEDRFRRAELMILLDKEWPAPPEAIKNAKWAWPIQWLRKIAGYPVQNETWLGANLTVLTDEEPPKPLGPGTAYTSWLLVSLPMNESIVKCKDGTTIQIYQLFPLYTDEYQYARKHGADTLMRLLMKQGIQTHIVPKRPNAAAASRKAADD